MLKLTISRPNTIGITKTKEFESYAHAEDYIERTVEALADKGWDITELEHSTSWQGTIECTHDHEADILIIEWETI